MCVFVCICVHVDAYTYIYTYTHIHTHTHIGDKPVPNLNLQHLGASMIMMPCKIHKQQRGLWGVTMFIVCPHAWPLFPLGNLHKNCGKLHAVPATDEARSDPDRMKLLRSEEVVYSASSRNWTFSGFLHGHGPYRFCFKRVGDCDKVVSQCAPVRLWTKTKLSRRDLNQTIVTQASLPIVTRPNLNYRDTFYVASRWYC